LARIRDIKELRPKKFGNGVFQKIRVQFRPFQIRRGRSPCPFRDIPPAPRLQALLEKALLDNDATERLECPEKFSAKQNFSTIGALPQRGHAAETPSSRFATPSLRFGAFGVTASHRRGKSPACLFGDRAAIGRFGHQRDM
jgi:hypothetical protein